MFFFLTLLKNYVQIHKSTALLSIVGVSDVSNYLTNQINV